MWKFEDERRRVVISSVVEKVREGRKLKCQHTFSTEFMLSVVEVLELTRALVSLRLPRTLCWEINFILRFSYFVYSQTIRPPRRIR